VGSRRSRAILRSLDFALMVMSYSSMPSAETNKQRLHAYSCCEPSMLIPQGVAERRHSRRCCRICHRMYTSDVVFWSFRSDNGCQISNRMRWCWTHWYARPVASVTNAAVNSSSVKLHARRWCERQVHDVNAWAYK